MGIILENTVSEFWKLKDKAEQLEFWNEKMKVLSDIHDAESIKEIMAVLHAYAVGERSEKITRTLMTGFDKARKTYRILFALSLMYLYKSESDEENSLLWKKTVDDLRGDEDEEEAVDFELQKYVEDKKTMMYHYVSNHINKVELRDNTITVLKGWSSTTPLIHNGVFGDERSGGGLYIRFNGCGIVIDPGCNFINNMHRHNIDILNVDYVIVTHNHFDHVCDLKGLQTLNYEYNKIIKSAKRELNTKMAPLKRHEIIWIVDRETEKDLPEEFDRGFVRIVSMDDSVDNGAGQMQLDWPLEAAVDATVDRVALKFFATRHTDTSYGVVLELALKTNLLQKCAPPQKIRIGYTSDTAYFNELERYLSDCTYVIANISEICSDDLHGKVSFSGGHLRLQGCVKIAERCKPQHMIISEFWGGKDDIRLMVVKKILYELQNEQGRCSDGVSKKVNVWPADIGFTIDMKEEKILCTNCKHFASSDDVISIQTGGSYGALSYICRTCRVDRE